MQQRFVFRIGEHRLIYGLADIGHNLGSVGKEMGNDVAEAAASKDLITYVGAPFAIAARGILKAPTNVLLGAIGKREEPFNGYELGRTVNETTDALTQFKIPTAVVKGVNVVEAFGLDVLRSMSGLHGKTRGQIQQTLIQK